MEYRTENKKNRTAASGRPVIIGLTGQTGAGKSVAAEIFTRHGYQTIDADIVSRDVMNAGTPCLEALTAHFGEAILNPDGSLHRKALAGIVFSDKQQLAMLNHISHPFIIEEINRRIMQYHAAGAAFILLDAPTLFESKACDICDRIIAVIADAALRCGRIRERDNLTEQEARERMQAQLDEAFFLAHADDILCNQGSLEAFRQSAGILADKIKAEYQNFL